MKTILIALTVLLSNISFAKNIECETLKEIEGFLPNIMSQDDLIVSKYQLDKNTLRGLNKNNQILFNQEVKRLVETIEICTPPSTGVPPGCRTEKMTHLFNSNLNQRIVTLDIEKMLLNSSPSTFFEPTNFLKRIENKSYEKLVEKVGQELADQFLPFAAGLGNCILL